MDEFEEHRGGGGPLMRRPPVHRSSSALAPRESLTPGVANSHYAKAVLMLLSSFYDTADGWTALPHPVVGGEYGNDDDRGGGRRGDPFVRLEDRYGCVGGDSADDNSGGRGGGEGE